MYVYVLCIPKEELSVISITAITYILSNSRFSYHVLNPFSQRDIFKEKVKKQLCAGLNAPSDGVQVMILFTHLSFIFHGMTNIICV